MTTRRRPDAGLFAGHDVRSHLNVLPRILPGGSTRSLPAGTPSRIFLALIGMKSVVRSSGTVAGEAERISGLVLLQVTWLLLGPDTAESDGVTQCVSRFVMSVT